jgi:hypothetical protein
MPVGVRLRHTRLRHDNLPQLLSWYADQAGVINQFSANDSPSEKNFEIGPNYSFVLRGYVRHWLGQVWEEYDRIKLKNIVAGQDSPRVQVVSAS